MSKQATLPATGNAISSPESAVGRSPCDSPAGPTIGQCGPRAFRVSRFRARDNTVAMPINAICGPLFSSSSPSARLQWSLASKLAARLAANGTPEFVLIWRQSDMPAGPPICRLRALARRTIDRAYIGWPTPTETDAKSSARHGYMITGNQGTTLLDQARLMIWPTPAATDGSKEAPVQHKRGNPSLPGLARSISGPTSDSSMSRTVPRLGLNPALSR